MVLYVTLNGLFHTSEDEERVFKSGWEKKNTSAAACSPKLFLIAKTPTVITPDTNLL